MKKKSKPKIIFIVPSLVAGGSERVISFVSQNINKDKFECILLVAGFSKDAVYDINNVKVNYLNKSRILFAIPSIIFYLINQKPRIVLSSISHLNIAMGIVSIFFRKTKFIGREATVLSADKIIRGTNKKRILGPALFKGFYKNLDLIVCQSKDMAMDMIKNYGISDSKIKIINNPISSMPALKNWTENNKIKSYITVGRLSKEKGIIRIIQILSKLDFPFTYTIVGDGDEKENIFQEAKKLGIFDKITHIPFTNNVNQYIAKHDIFLQGSFVEGFPNAVLESCVVGTPVIAFNVPGGTKEIIEHGVNGFLVESEDEFIKYLQINNSWNPELIRESVVKKFNKEKIIGKYEEMFLNILKQ